MGNCRVIVTYRYRIKDRHSAALCRMARAVNSVWNYCGEVQDHAAKWDARWPSHFTLTSLTTGVASELGVHSDTIGEVCRIFVQSRNAAKRRPRWRGQRSLGWVPFKGRAIQVGKGVATYRGKAFGYWDSRPLPGPVKAGSFGQDSRGRWYVNFQVEVEADAAHGNGQIGIDLGLKSLAACSDGATIPNLRHVQRYAKALATAQRARRKKRAAAVHAKIANSRRHHLHEVSTRLIRANQRIVVGNVSSARLAKTKMAKSVLDAGWASFRDMLRYKAIAHGAEYIEVDEQFTTQTCSDCGSISGPKGIAGLEMRAWECPDCGATHDRDTNAARNILRLGAECRPPVGGSALSAGINSKIAVEPVQLEGK